MKKIFPAILILSALLLTSCGRAAAPAEPQAKQPESVAALSKSIGELWLLSGGQLSGITSDGMSLTGIGKDAVSVGTVSDPSLESILSLNPDMVC
jgi:iron complex transport system substrate-binding protein